MRIAYFVNRFPLLSETFILGQITGMIDRGHDVRIFATGRAPTDAAHPLVGEYDLLGRTTFGRPVNGNLLARLPRAVRVIGLAGKSRQLRAALRALDIRRHGRNALGLNLLLQIEPFLGQPRFDVLHCQFGDVGPFALRLKQLGLFDGALVVSFRGWDTTQYPGLHPDGYRELFEQAAAFLPVSASLAGRLIALGCPRERISILRSGIDLRRFRLRSPRAAGVPAALTTVGRLTEKKGMEYGIRAVRKLLDQGQPVHYRIAGDGPLSRSLRRLVTELQLDAHVRFFGSLSSTEVIRLLETSDVFLAPSVTGAKGNEEGIPNALKEAMAIGVPVVSCRHGGIPELVEDGVSGFLVDERDPQALADRVMDLIGQSELRAAHTAKARKAIEDHYEIGALNDQLIALYERVVASESVT